MVSVPLVGIASVGRALGSGQKGAFLTDSLVLIALPVTRGFGAYDRRPFKKPSGGVLWLQSSERGVYLSVSLQGAYENSHCHALEQKDRRGEEEGHRLVFHLVPQC